MVKVSVVLPVRKDKISLMGYSLSKNCLTKSEICHKCDLNTGGEDNIYPLQPPK